MVKDRLIKGIIICTLSLIILLGSIYLLFNSHIIPRGPGASIVYSYTGGTIVIFVLSIFGLWVGIDYFREYREIRNRLQVKD